MSETRRAYIGGLIEVEEFEELVGEMLAHGIENELAPVDPRADLLADQAAVELAAIRAGMPPPPRIIVPPARRR